MACRVFTFGKTQIAEKWLKTGRVFALGLRPEDCQSQTAKEAQPWGKVKSWPVVTVYKVFLKTVPDDSGKNRRNGVREPERSDTNRTKRNLVQRPWARAEISDSATFATAAQPLAPSLLHSMSLHAIVCIFLSVAGAASGTASVGVSRSYVLCAAS